MEGQFRGKESRRKDGGIVQREGDGGRVQREGDKEGRRKEGGKFTQLCEFSVWGGVRVMASQNHSFHCWDAKSSHTSPCIYMYTCQVWRKGNREDELD